MRDQDQGSKSFLQGDPHPLEKNPYELIAGTLVANGSPTRIFSTSFFRCPLTASKMSSWDGGFYFARRILYKSNFHRTFWCKTTCINISFAEQQVWLWWPSAALTQKSATLSTYIKKYHRISPDKNRYHSINLYQEVSQYQPISTSIAVST